MTTDPKLEDLLADDTFNSGEEFCIVYLYIYSVLLFHSFPVPSYLSVRACS